MSGGAGPTNSEKEIFMLRSLEEIDPVLLDQAIRRLLAQPRAIDREAAIATHLEKSSELKEWVEMLNHNIWQLTRPLKLSLSEGHVIQLYIAFALGLETGYVLYEKELER
jgi:hypothetical protein